MLLLFLQNVTAIDPFWPRFEVIDGRPDWLVKTMGRKPVYIPNELRIGTGRRLIQAFNEGDPDSAIPADQVILDRPEAQVVLMLPSGKFRARAVDERTTVLGATTLQSP